MGPKSLSGNWDPACSAVTSSLDFSRRNTPVKGPELRLH
jgi:hypothetical protein